MYFIEKKSPKEMKKQRLNQVQWVLNKKEVQQIKSKENGWHFKFQIYQHDKQADSKCAPVQE